MQKHVRDSESLILFSTVCQYKPVISYCYKLYAKLSLSHGMLESNLFDGSAHLRASYFHYLLVILLLGKSDTVGWAMLSYSEVTQRQFPLAKSHDYLILLYLTEEHVDHNIYWFTP